MVLSRVYTVSCNRPIRGRIICFGRAKGTDVYIIIIIIKHFIVTVCIGAAQLSSFIKKKKNVLASRIILYTCMLHADVIVYRFVAPEKLFAYAYSIIVLRYNANGEKIRILL